MTFTAGNTLISQFPTSPTLASSRRLILFFAHGDLMYLNALDNLANLIFLGAYLVKDILWLRLLAMMGSLVLIPYYLLRPEPLWPPVMWSCVFIGIHAMRAWGIVKERP
jgi:hypothetical protein